MTRISVDEYLAKRSMSVRKEDGVVFRSAAPAKSFEQENRSCRFLMTDESVDSYGDEVKAKGAILDRFEKNPIALLNHRSFDPIGTWSDIEKKSTSILGTVTLAEAGTSAEVDKVFKLMSQGILKAASIGFLPKEIEMKRDNEGRALWEFIIHEWELFECSIVAVPANANALAKAMKEGDGMCRDMIEQILDTYAKMPSGLIVSREEFEKAHKEGSGERKSIVVKVGDQGKLIADIVEKAVNDAISQLAIEPEPTPDPIVKELEDAMSTFEKKLDGIPEEEKERKGLLSKLFGDIRSMFKTAPEPKEPAVEEPEKPVLATEAEKQAVKAELLRLQAEDLAA